MRFGSVLYYLVVATAKANDTIATKQGLEDITYRAIETNQNGVNIMPVKALNLEGDKCFVTSSVTCMVDRTGEDCNDYIVPINECNTEELMKFTFEYCNNEDTFLKFHTQKFMALVETLPVSGFDLTDLPSKECRYFTEIRPINTCKRFFSSSLKLEGWRDGGAGDYCYAYDFERIDIDRPDDSPLIPGDDKPNDVKPFITGSTCSLVLDRDVCTLQDFTKCPSYCAASSNTISFTTNNAPAGVEIPVLIRKKNQKIGTFRDNSNSRRENSTHFISGQSDAGIFNLFSTSKGNIVGSFVDLNENTVSQIRIHSNGTQMISTTSSLEFDNEIDAEIVDLNPLKGESRRRTNEDNGVEIDVMVVWTKKAECLNARREISCKVNAITKDFMQALVNLAVQETNVAMSNSGVSTQLNLVHSYRSNYNENDGSTSLTDLRQGKVNGLKQVNQNREKFGADVVAMIIGKPFKYCGRGYVG